MRAISSVRRLPLLAPLAAFLVLALPGGAQATTFTVNNLGDGASACPGTCTLRQAILTANGSAGADDIVFSVSGTISPTTQLPDVTQSVTIDGASGGAPSITLNGGTAGNLFEGLKFTGTGNSSTVRGLGVINFDSAGIDVRGGASATIQGNHLGLDAAGNPGANRFDGVYVHANAAGATIGGTGAGQGNVISANGGDGIFIEGSGPVVAIHGNRIGTNPAGTAAAVTGLAAQPNGVVVNGSGHVVGGPGAGQGNQIAGNGSAGVFFDNSAAPGSSVEGNVIGLAADGVTAIDNTSGVSVTENANGSRVGGSAPGQGNVIAGNESNVSVDGDGARIEGNTLGLNQNGGASGSVLGVAVSTKADGTVIGGSTEGARNVLSGNSGGVQTGGPNTRIVGNYIGLAPDGLAQASNGTSGVIVQTGADNTQVGGPGAGEGNLISGNNSAGLVVRRGVSGVLIRGNGIGVNKNGEPRRNLTAGVRIFDAAGNTVGGPNPEDANTIAFNGAQGVDIDLNDPTDPLFEQPVGNQVMRNSIRDNGAIGIDLSAQLFGRTDNDAGDGDTGANDLQNFPLLATAYDGGGSTAVAGTLNSKPGAPYKLRFWSNPGGTDEAETYLGEQDVTTDGGGNASFTFTATPAVALGRAVTATATDGAGNTSEISDPVTVQTPPTPGPPGGSGPPPAGPVVDPRLGVLGFRTTSFKVSGSFITFRVTNRVTFDFVIRVTGREGTLRAARAPAFKSVRATIKAGNAKTIKLRIPAAQRTAIKRALKKHKRVVRRPSIRIANVTSGTSRQYKPRLTVKR